MAGEFGMKIRLPKNHSTAAHSPAAKTPQGYVSSERIRTWPAKERPRERLLAEGPERLTDAELLAIILRVGLGTFKEGVPGKNVYETALSILRDFRGLRGLDRARTHDLLKVPGIGPAKVAQIKAAFELGKRLCAGKLTAPAFESSKAVANHFRPRFTGKREEIVIAPVLERAKPMSWRERHHRGHTDPGHRVCAPHSRRSPPPIGRGNRPGSQPPLGKF